MKENSRKSIDELFKSKLNNFEYNHKGSSWQFLNHLMKENNRKKKLSSFRLGGLLTIGLIITVLFILKVNSENKNSLYKKQSKTVDKSKINDLGKLNNKQISTPKKPKKETPKSKYVDNISNADLSLTKKNVLLNLDKNESLLIDNDAGKISTVDAIIDTEGKSSTENDNYLESSANEYYVNWNQNKVKVNIQNIGKHINSSFADYAPVINADGSIMYFTSRRPITEKQKKKNRIAPESIYATSFDSDKNTWNKAKLLSPPVNLSNRFNSIIGLSNDGERMLLYRDDKYGNGNIFESNLNGQEWSTPVCLPKPINSKHIETSASISPDGKTIYFVSNRPGGQGSLDIWYCTLNKQGEWGEAMNLGGLVNTPEKEEGVFIHPDGKTLYFSSKGHGGEGGYDILYTQLENGKWTKPQNLGKAVNSPDDDVYFVMEANGKVGYYSSIREDGLGEKDIYRIEFISSSFSEDMNSIR